MPQQGFIIRALIASPGDVPQERQAIPEVIRTWNATHSLAKGVVIEPVKWESHSVPGLEGRPQEMLNHQLVRVCDFLIGVFWTRLGTHTGVAESGTVEEINEFRRAGKPVYLYFSSRPVEPQSIDPAQYKRLNQFRARLEKDGLIEKYQEIGEFREKLFRHLTAAVDEVLRAGNLTIQEHENAVLNGSEMVGSALQDQFETFTRRLAAEWSTERDSEPMNVENARDILRQATAELLDFVSHLRKEENKGFRAELQELAKRLKALQRKQLFLDGGKTYREFWQEGDAILNDLEACAMTVKS